MDEDKRSRAKRKRIRVTFQNGKVICYSNATETMIAVLVLIGVDRFPSIKLEMCHLPLLSQEVYPKYKAWMKMVCSGWYINTQSDTITKYMQLCAINDQLSLGLKIEIGTDLEVEEMPKKQRTRSKDKLLVTFPNGYCIANSHTLDTYLETIWQLGVDEIRRKELTWGGKPLFTSVKTYNSQVQVDENCWMIVPSMTKDKVKMLRVIAAMLHVNLELTII